LIKANSAKKNKNYHSIYAETFFINKYLAKDFRLNFSKLNNKEIFDFLFYGERSTRAIATGG
jgi:hypothetical protein